MKQTIAHFAMREWQALRASRALWVGMVAAGAVLGLIGPFGTETALAAGPRLIYWTAIAVITFTTGYCLAGGTIKWASETGRPAPFGIALGSVVSAVVIYGEVLAINVVAVGSLPADMGMTLLGANILGIVVIITLAAYLITGQDAQAAEDAPRLLQRVPVPVRGPLISLSVTDHYVHVTTARGRHMLLMRLSDAIAETEPTPGFQIHRSHWVAQDAIGSVHSTSRKSEVVLHSGERLPVSRTYLPQLKDAGFAAKIRA